MRLKTAGLILSATLIIGALWFYLFVDNLSVRRPDVIELTDSRQYIVERVHFPSFFFGEDLSYLRIVDQDAPKYIYRSPLYPTRLLVLQVKESKGRVSVPNIEFLTTEKMFVFHDRRWEDRAMNYFVSNTSYVVESLSEGDK